MARIWHSIKSSKIWDYFKPSRLWNSLKSLFSSKQTSTVAKTLKPVQVHVSQPIRMDPAFQASKLTPSIATARDLPEVCKLMTALLSEKDSFEGTRLTLKNRTDEELLTYFKRMMPLEQLQDPTAKAEFLQNVRNLLDDPEACKATIGSVSNNAKEAESMMLPLLRQRFIDNPKGALIVLKDPNGNIVATEACNQFQDTHDFHIDQGIFDAVDLKHGLETMLYVKPEYRSKGLATGLKKAILQYANKNLQYRYLWSPTEAGNASHRINQKFGYQPLTEQTSFTDSPAFTKAKNKALMDEYNVDARQLAWIDIHVLKDKEFVIR